MKTDYMTGYDNGYSDGIKAEREKQKAVAPAQPCGDESEGRRIRWGKSDYERLLDALLRAQMHTWSGEHMDHARGMLGCCPDVSPLSTCATSCGEDAANDRGNGLWALRIKKYQLMKSRRCVNIHTSTTRSE